MALATRHERDSGDGETAEHARQEDAAARGTGADARGLAAEARTTDADARGVAADARRLAADARAIDAETHAPGADAGTSDADARGVAADTREETADARGVSADAREADANEREIAADAREASADARSVDADARGVLHAQELERRRLARELHDETGQGLTSILLALGALKGETDPQASEEGLSAVQELVVSTLQGVRELAFELRPRALDDFGLAAALERLAETFQERTGIAVAMAARLDGRLSEDTESALYRLVQEALTNVVKHAHANQVSIVLSQSGDALVAIVEDDGEGFAANATAGEGFGLIAMRERIALLGGEIAIESSVGAGTTLRATIPVGGTAEPATA